MGRTYGDAWTTLILDSELQTVVEHTTPNHIFLAHLYCSGWASRGWTLQEGTLAKQSTIVAIKNGVIDLSALHAGRQQTHKVGTTHECRTATIDPSYREILYETSRDRIPFWKRSIRRDWEDVAQSRNGRKLGDIWDALVERTTSQSSDIAAIMASLTNFKPFDVLKVPSHQRVASMLLAGDSIPIGFLFQQGPRLRAPLIILTDMTSTDATSQTPKGLVDFMKTEENFWTNSWLPEQIAGELLWESWAQCRLGNGSLRVFSKTCCVLLTEAPQKSSDEYLITTVYGQVLRVETFREVGWAADAKQQLKQEYQKYLILAFNPEQLEPGTFIRGAQLICLERSGYGVYECPIRVTLFDAASLHPQIASQDSLNGVTPIVVRAHCENVVILFGESQLMLSRYSILSYEDPLIFVLLTYRTTRSENFTATTDACPLLCTTFGRHTWSCARCQLLVGYISVHVCYSSRSISRRTSSLYSRGISHRRSLAPSSVRVEVEYRTRSSLPEKTGKRKCGCCIEHVWSPA